MRGQDDVAQWLVCLRMLVPNKASAAPLPTDPTVDELDWLFRLASSPADFSRNMEVAVVVVMAELGRPW